MFALAERRKNEKIEFRAQISQADGSLTPGFVKQRIRSPDTLFFYATRVGVARKPCDTRSPKAGQNGLPPGVGAMVFQTIAVEA